MRAAIDQCADVGFEMVILTFGSGFDLENERPGVPGARSKELADYAHAKGIESAATRCSPAAVGDANDVINPRRQDRRAATFGNSPCLGSAWGADYFRKLTILSSRRGLDVLEHDGSYPGDVCASHAHPGHRGLDDSQWEQWRAITDFYRWCRGRGHLPERARPVLPRRLAARPAWATARRTGPCRATSRRSSSARTSTTARGRRRRAWAGCSCR